MLYLPNDAEDWRQFCRAKLLILRAGFRAAIAPVPRRGRRKTFCQTDYWSSNLRALDQRAAM